MLYLVTTNSNKIREPTLLQGLRYKLMIEYKDTVGRTRRYYIVTGQYLNEEVIQKIITNRDNDDDEFLLGKAIFISKK